MTNEPMPGHGRFVQHHVRPGKARPGTRVSNVVLYRDMLCRTRTSANLRTSAGRAPPRWVPADETRQLVLCAGVVRNRESGTELAARSHRVLERCRAGD